MTNIEGVTSGGIFATAPTVSTAVMGIYRRHRIARRVIAAMLDEALARAQASTEQRARILRARDRAFGAIDAHLESRFGSSCRFVEAYLRETVCQRFGAGPIDGGSFLAWRFLQEERAAVEAISQFVWEMYSAFTHSQRQAVGDYVRATLAGFPTN